jgi:hypothetical protein
MAVPLVASGYAASASAKPRNTIGCASASDSSAFRASRRKETSRRSSRTSEVRSAVRKNRSGTSASLRRSAESRRGAKARNAVPLNALLASPTLSSHVRQARRPASPS